jgi:hypothetical protein
MTEAELNALIADLEAITAATENKAAAAPRRRRRKSRRP